ncbi:sugar phosphate isomerase/epimerase [Flavihumibacter fluvii]|uniref:sugar phosphate isomerase/epimerase n=1 Tax=Flavihumibacter fluvii TaxID=2838157 RepID=UPI001BDE0A66|nr:sugar phosphate isomerase/epimerase [Flavihumibacter fluvii]ULQ51525.1 sugar phosphate isomerase/epimerase [Flavihumibacter fluvii]
MKSPSLFGSYAMRGWLFLSAMLFTQFSVSLNAQQISHKRNFSKQDIVAWCIVPFDSKNRGPVERANMLNEIGITKLAYDWRDNNIPTFDQELDALKQHHILLQAFWLTSGVNPSGEKGVEEVFKFLARRKVKTQIWYLFFPPAGFDSLPQKQKLGIAVSAVSYIAKRADSLGCTVGLYNHEGWFGEPENELAIIEMLKMANVGIVYNFNHAQDQIERFPKFYPKLLPHLMAINLAGLKKGDQHIYPIGQGDSESGMIEIVWKSSYKGPIGIINENTHPDAEVGLKMNMSGLKAILESIGDKTAAASF